MACEAPGSSSSWCFIFLTHCDPVTALSHQFLKEAKLFPTWMMLYRWYLHLGIHFSLPFMKVASLIISYTIFLQKVLPHHLNKSRHCPSQVLVYFLHSTYQNLTIFLFKSVLHRFLSHVWGQGCVHHSTSSAQHNAWHKTDVHYTPNECVAYLTVFLYSRTELNKNWFFSINLLLLDV